MAGELNTEFQMIRREFEDKWKTLHASYSPEELAKWKIDIKPLLRQQKKMLHFLGSGVESMKNHIEEMLKLNEIHVMYSFPDDGQFSKDSQGNMLMVLKLQKKMNKTCAMLLKKAKKNEEQERKEMEKEVHEDVSMLAPIDEVVAND